MLVKVPLPAFSQGCDEAPIDAEISLTHRTIAHSRGNDGAIRGDAKIGNQIVR